MVILNAFNLTCNRLLKLVLKFKDYNILLQSIIFVMLLLLL